MGRPFIRELRDGLFWYVQIKMLDGSWKQYNTKIRVVLGEDGTPTGESLRKALTAQARLQTAETRGDRPFAPQEDKSKTVRLLFARFLDVKRLEIEYESCRLYEVTFDKWLELMGDCSISSINSESVAKFVKRRMESGAVFPNGKRRSVGKHTANRDIRHLRTFVRWAEENGILDKSPKLREMKVAVRQYPRFSNAEMERLMAAAEQVTIKGIPFSLLIGVSASTGLRISELLELQWSMIKGDVIEIPAGLTKTDAALFIPITEFLREFLQRIPRTGAYLFPISRGSGSVRDKWLEVCKLAGIEQKMHTLRHTAAGLFVDQGVPPQVLQHVLHSSFETTMKYYLKPDAQSLEVARNRLNESPLGAILLRHSRNDNKNKE